MVDFAVVPERTALINVDLQNCFVQGYPISAPDGLVVLDRINRLAAVCRAAGIWSFIPAMCCGPTARIRVCWARWPHR